MTRAINLAHQPRQNLGQFQEFTFIGKTSGNLPLKSAKQLHLNANNNFLSEAKIKNFWQITQIHTSKSLLQQLKALGIELGAVIELVTKSDRGSAVVSCQGKLIGIGGEIAHNIVVTLAGSKTQQ